MTGGQRTRFRVETIPIYTIGYGNRTMSDFIKLLKNKDMGYKIQCLVDLRSQPYSRFKPEFSQRELEQHLKQAGIRYLFMGDTLGGRPGDDDCYTRDRRVDYVEVRKKAFFWQGIDRILAEWDKQWRIALMCSELKPEECHRSKLIGTTLHEDKRIEVAHIDEEGKLKTQENIYEILLGKNYKMQQGNIFGQEEEKPKSMFSEDKIRYSRKKYPQQDMSE